MPRIRVAFGVLVTVAFCIGFNVTQYPAVWQMVGGGAKLPGDAGAARPAADTKVEHVPKTPARSAAVARPTKPVTVVAYPSTSPPAAVNVFKPDQGKTAAKGGDMPAQGESADGLTKLSATQAKAAEQPLNKIGPLVPILRSASDDGRPGKSTNALLVSSSSSGSVNRTDRHAASAVAFQRLPPLNSAQQDATAPSASMASDAIPFYPTTGR